MLKIHEIKYKWRGNWNRTFIYLQEISFLKKWMCLPSLAPTALRLILCFMALTTLWLSGFSLPRNTYISCMSNRPANLFNAAYLGFLEITGLKLMFLKYRWSLIKNQFNFQLVGFFESMVRETFPVVSSQSLFQTVLLSCIGFRIESGLQNCLAHYCCCFFPTWAIKTVNWILLYISMLKWHRLK